MKKKKTAEITYLTYMYLELLNLTYIAKITVNDSITLKDTILQSGHVSAQVFTERYKR